MVREITPARTPLDARVNVPGSKSITNRALICAALAKGESVIRNASESDDTALMANGLNQLGVLVRKKADALIVEGTGGKLYAPKFPIPVGNAGTTLRFLLSLAALAEGTTTFDADARMAERPNEELLDALGQLGVKAQRLGSRFMVRGGSLVGGLVEFDSEKSSQFLSSLLMVSPYATSDVTIRAKGNLSSASYVEMTLEVMKQFGAEADRSSNSSFRIRTKRKYVPRELCVEPDASSASYFFAAAAICGGRVAVNGLKFDSLQGDVKFADVLKMMGCTIEEKPDGVECVGNRELKGLDVDMNSMPDVVPTLAVAALFATSPTRIRNIAQLRHKESDRLSALEYELKRLGANITAGEDWLKIVPTQLHGAQLDTHDDHRLAMSFALVGLKVPDVTIENPNCVRKSFPKFWEQFAMLTADSITPTLHQSIHPTV